MKKTVSMVLILVFVLFLISCNKPVAREISCEEIIAAYESAGYYVSHGRHMDESEGAQLCYIKASISESPDSDYIYFVTCFTEEQAEAVRKTDKYNLIVWLYAAINGEGRWLRTGTYGKIEYSYYNSELIKPFEELRK